MNDLGWQALALALTLLAGTWTYVAASKKRTAAALRGAGITVLIPAALLTGTLEMGGEIVDAVADWATGLVFSPSVWLGVVLAGIGAALWLAGGWLAARQTLTGPTGQTGALAGSEPTSSQRPSATKPGKRGAPAIDDDLSDIEALLKKRGIN